MIKTSVLFLCAATFACAQPEELNLMPWPVSLEHGQGTLAIDDNFSVKVTGAGGERVRATVERLYRRSSAHTGMVLPNPMATSTTPVLTIECASPGKPVNRPIMWTVTRCGRFLSRIVKSNDSPVRGRI